MSIPTYDIAGLRVSAVTIDSLHAAVSSAIESKRRFIMVSQNLHSVYLQRDHQELRQLHTMADCVRIDGMPILWLSRLYGIPVRSENRIGWMDWMHRFMQTAERGRWRIFYVGSTEEVKDEALRRLMEWYPRLEIAGVGGYFDASKGSSDSLAVIDAAHEFGADILLVGMGMPRQERWLLDHGPSLAVPVLLTCGAAMDFVAGAQSTPPRWLGKVGLEWLYRLVADPRRMWFRYLVEPWYAVGVFVKGRLRRERA